MKKTAGTAAAAKKNAGKTTTSKPSAKQPAARPRRAAAIADAPRPPAPPADTLPEPQRGARHLLTAGIKALTTVHEEAVERQSRVFESLLGVRRDDAGSADRKPAAVPGTTLDPFGFRKFEDVFDQRVAGALQHLDVPTAQAFADLKAEVEQLRQTVAALEAQARRR